MKYIIKILSICFLFLVSFSFAYGYTLTTKDYKIVTAFESKFFKIIDEKASLTPQKAITVIEKFMERKKLSQRTQAVLEQVIIDTKEHYGLSKTFQYPKGVYVSAGPTSEQRLSLSEKNTNLDYIDGVLLRVNWKLLESTDDNFDWSLIEEQIEIAEKFDKKIALAIGVGASMPDWLIKKSDYLSYDLIREQGYMPVPWDTSFQTEWSEFVEQLGKKFNGNKTISLVYITNSSFNGYEMQLPRGEINPSLEQAGYSDQKMIDSWKNAIYAFAKAFPDHVLTNDFHPINGSNTPSEEIYDYAKDTLGNKYGASAWWWSEKNTSTYPNQYEILQNSAKDTFATVQVARNGTRDSKFLGSNGLEGTIDLAIQNNICYWEIWEIDVLNDDFTQMLQEKRKECNLK